MHWRPRLHQDRPRKVTYTVLCLTQTCYFPRFIQSLSNKAGEETASLFIGEITIGSYSKSRGSIQHRGQTTVVMSQDLLLSLLVFFNIIIKSSKQIFSQVYHPWYNSTNSIELKSIWNKLLLRGNSDKKRQAFDIHPGKVIPQFSVNVSYHAGDDVQLVLDFFPFPCKAQSYKREQNISPLNPACHY